MSIDDFIAIDIGNARIKLGLFAGDCTAELPEPIRTLPLLGNTPELDAIHPWLADESKSKLTWWIASVNRPAASRLIDWLRTYRPDDRVTLLAAGDLPLQVLLERPDMVGIDRLVDAVAVNRMRQSDRPAVIVDVGTAITVDRVSEDGAFLGGAILPGIQMSARALHEFTDLLPLVDMSELVSPPAPLGRATVAAMESGLFWGSLGAIRELIERFQKAATGAHAMKPQVFLTGGAGQSVAELLGPDARYVPNLTLAGIALTARQPHKSR
jgi:type III pantothenate kinase